MRTFLLIIGLLFIVPTSVFALEAGECSKQEVLELVRGGYSKEDIEDICNSALADPKCCCQEIGYGMMDFRTGKRPYLGEGFVWKIADDCYTAPFGFGLEKVRRCVDAARCGR